MLCNPPAEIQIDILSYLSLNSLAQVARTCHHLHLLAVPSLYKTVTLTSWSDLVGFFALPNGSLPKDPNLALERVQRRRVDLDRVRRLVLDFPSQWVDDVGGRDVVPVLPRSHPLLQLAARPLQLDLLRISYPLNLRPIVSLLKSVTPSRVELQRCLDGSSLPDSEFNVLLMVGNRTWTRLHHLSYGTERIEGEYSGLGGRSLLDSPFSSVEDVVFRASRQWPDEFEPSLDKLVSFCPTVKRLIIEADMDDAEDLPREDFAADVRDSAERILDDHGRTDVELQLKESRGVRIGINCKLWPGDEDV